MTIDFSLLLHTVQIEQDRQLTLDTHEIDQIVHRISHVAHRGAIDLLSLGQALRETGEHQGIFLECVRLETRPRKQGQDLLTGVIQAQQDGQWVEGTALPNDLVQLLKQMVEGVLQGSKTKGGLGLIEQTILTRAFARDEPCQGQHWCTMPIGEAALDARARQVVGEANWSHYQAALLERSTDPGRGRGTGVRL